jgi:hypothetical protein
MQTPSPAPFLNLTGLQLVANPDSPVRPQRVTITFTGWDGEAVLASLTATMEIPRLDSQRTWQDVQRDLAERLHAMLDPARLRL